MRKIRKKKGEKNKEDRNKGRQTDK